MTGRGFKIFWELYMMIEFTASPPRIMKTQLRLSTEH